MGTFGKKHTGTYLLPVVDSVTVVTNNNVGNIHDPSLL